MEFDDIDAGILAKREALRNELQGPRIGDYVQFPTGELERFSHDWGDGLQTSPGGSFYLGAAGGASFSGGLNPATPADKLERTKATLPGTFWFFHHDYAGAHLGVYFQIACRVYRTTAAYEGYLGSDFKSQNVEMLRRDLAKQLEAT